MSEYAIVFVTAVNISEAKKISKALLGEKLAACVNIIKITESLFWWQGKIESSREVLLIIKTRRKLFARISRLVTRCHSYDTPEIISFSLENIAPNYRRWLNASIRKSS